MTVKPIDIASQIGIPATLEQCAEECMELGQACLKLARKLRGENPTPMEANEIRANITEEIADVMICMYEVIESGELSFEAIESEMMFKRDRWPKRVKENKEKENE